MLKEAKLLYDRGFAIIALHPKSKRPKGMKWTSGDRGTWNQFVGQYEKGDNIGVRVGAPSKIGKFYLACIDIDVKRPDYLNRALTLLDKTLGLSLSGAPQVISGAGNGSRHIYVLTEKPFKMITLDKRTEGEVCVYSNGRQMVLPPSIHPSGKLYKWVKPFDGSSLPLIMTEVFQGFIKKEETLIKDDYKVEDSNFEKVDVEWLSMPTEIRDGIVDGVPKGERSEFIWRAINSLLSNGLERHEILSVLTDPRYKISEAALERRGSRKSAAQWINEYFLKQKVSERDPKKVFTKATKAEKVLSSDEETKQTEEFLEEINWRQDLDRNQHGKAKITLRNLDLIFTNSVDGVLFKRDTFSNRTSYGVDAPWGSKKDRYIEDIDLILMKHWLGNGEFNIEPSKEALFEAADILAHRERFHPVQEWLTGLKWDGKRRIHTWLKDYCLAEAEEPYLSEVSIKFLCAMVKRVFHPACQWDYTLILEGPQGKFKSSIARAIASDKWFMDNLPDLRDKDAMLNLQGKWLIELGELTNVKRSDFNLVKQYLTRRIDTVRPHYGRIMSDVPRQSVFIGTVNEGHYLKDPTGNRRFWPVKVGECDVKGLLKVRDQLFAEAFARYSSEELKLSDLAERQANDAQDDRRIEDENTSMEEALRDFMNSENAKEFNWEKFKTKDLFSGLPWAPFSNKPYAFQNASTVLKNLGFTTKKVKGIRTWRRGVEGVSTPLKNGKYVNGHGGVEGVDRGVEQKVGRHPGFLEEN